MRQDDQGSLAQLDQESVATVNLGDPAGIPEPDLGERRSGRVPGRFGGNVSDPVRTSLIAYRDVRAEMPTVAVEVVDATIESLRSEIRRVRYAAEALLMADCLHGRGCMDPIHSRVWAALG